MLWAIQERMKLALSVIDMIPDVHRTPALAAQRVEYLQKSLQAYQGGQRRNSVMAAMSGSLTDADVAGLSAHYARQKARPFVFVMVPAR